MKLIGSKKIVISLALVSALTVMGVIGFAQQAKTEGQGGQERAERQWRRGDRAGGHRGMEDGFEHRFAEKLNLTDAQKEQIKQIATRYREGARAQRQQRQAEGRRGGDFSLFNGGTFDEAAVRAAAQARANAQVEREVAHAHMMYEMYNVLTPEQKSQLQAERQQWEQKRQEWRARRGAKTGQTQ